MEEAEQPVGRPAPFRPARLQRKCVQKPVGLRGEELFFCSCLFPQEFDDAIVLQLAHVVQHAGANPVFLGRADAVAQWFERNFWELLDEPFGIQIAVAISSPGRFDQNLFFALRLKFLPPILRAFLALFALAIT